MLKSWLWWHRCNIWKIFPYKSMFIEFIELTMTWKLYQSWGMLPISCFVYLVYFAYSFAVCWRAQIKVQNTTYKTIPLKKKKYIKQSLNAYFEQIYILRMHLFLHISIAMFFCNAVAMFFISFFNNFV